METVHKQSNRLRKESKNAQERLRIKREENSVGTLDFDKMTHFTEE